MSNKNSNNNQGTYLYPPSHYGNTPTPTGATDKYGEHVAVQPPTR